MSGCEAKVPALRFRMSHAEAQRRGEGGCVSSSAECRARTPAAPWERKSLGRWLVVSDMENQDNQFTAEDVLSVSGGYGVVNQIEFKGRSFAGASLKHYRILRKNQVVYTKSPLKLAPFGIVKANLFQDGIVSALYGVYDVIDADPSFVQYHFESIPRLNNYFRPLVNKGAKNTLLISDEDAVSGEVYFPAVLEQRKIGFFFHSLDALIVGREKALEKLEALKKSMLLKMFPQGDATVPEVRFKGFAGDWEKKRLGDVAKRITRKNTKLESELPLTISAEHGLIDQYEFFNNRVAARDVSGYYLVCRGEFAYNKSTSDGWPWGVVKQLKYYPMGVLSTLYIVFAINEKELDAEYVEKYFETTLWHYDVSIRAAEGARNHGLLNITASDFLETTLLTPSLPEQQKIGAYFRSLDALLAARREEIGKLQQMKKALLERMFV